MQTHCADLSVTTDSQLEVRKYKVLSKQFLRGTPVQTHYADLSVTTDSQRVPIKRYPGPRGFLGSWSAVLFVVGTTPLLSYVFVPTISLSPRLSFIALCRFRDHGWYFGHTSCVSTTFSVRDLIADPRCPLWWFFRNYFTRLSISETSPANSHDIRRSFSVFLFFFCNSRISCLHSNKDIALCLLFWKTMS